MLPVTGLGRTRVVKTIWVCGIRFFKRANIRERVFRYYDSTERVGGVSGNRMSRIVCWNCSYIVFKILE